MNSKLSASCSSPTLCLPCLCPVLLSHLIFSNRCHKFPPSQPAEGLVLNQLVFWRRRYSPKTWKLDQLYSKYCSPIKCLIVHLSWHVLPWRSPNFGWYFLCKEELRTKNSSNLLGTINILGSCAPVVSNFWHYTELSTTVASNVDFTSTTL